MEKALQELIKFIETRIFQVFLDLLDERHFQYEANFIEYMFLRIDFLQHGQHGLFLSTLKCLYHSQLQGRLQKQEHFISLKLQLFIEDEHDEARKYHPFHKLNGVLDHPIHILTESHIEKQGYFSVILHIDHILLSTLPINLQKIIGINLAASQKVGYALFGKVAGKLKGLDKVAEL